MAKVMHNETSHVIKIDIMQKSQESLVRCEKQHET
jgi:hypothetical protein